MSKTLLTLITLVLFTNQLYDSKSKVVKLTVANFKKLVLNSDDLWLVEFYAPWCGHCKSLAPEFNKAANALSGIVKLGAVDMTKEESVGSPYGIKGFPTLKFFGDDKKKPKDYNSARKADAMANYCVDQAQKVVRSRLSGKTKPTKKKPTKKSTGQKKTKGKNSGGKVVELTESMFNKEILNSESLWFVLFYAPWCGHCKAIMPDWALSAAETDKVVNFGKLDCTKNQSLCQNYQVKGYPTMKFFTKGQVEDYNGGRSKSDLVAFANLKGDTYKPAKLLKEMTDQSVYDDYCKESDGLCLIAFLPHIKDSGEKKRKEYLSWLNEVKDNNKGRPLSFLWVQGGDNFNFEESLNLGFGFPAVVAIHTGKEKFSVMRAAFNSKNVDNFIGDLWTGKASLYNLRKNLPKIKKKKVKKNDKVTTEL